MQPLTICPVCFGSFGRCRALPTAQDTDGFDCDGCGKFEISRSVLSTRLQRDQGGLTALQRSALSHALRNVSRAGVIDNILRAKIRDAAFILVDLTHDNAGAYWETGYAEGLGKPVIYLCEQTKFEAAKTHFDTNHCTTIMWSAASPAPFPEALVATLRRSLGLFPDA